MEEELVGYIASNLVNNPEQVSVMRRDSGRTIVLELSVAPEDMGRVIGKNGRVANAIRALLRALNEDDNRARRVILEIE
jgi:predicted RNA-binding protein YlqC (UPF0109 family)